MIQPETTPEPSPLMTPAEVQQALNVSRSTLVTWDAEGLLKSIRLPKGHRRYRRADVEAIERGEVPA